MSVYIIGSSSINPVTELENGKLPLHIELTQEQRVNCIEPDYKTYIQDAGTRRRMSRAVRMGVAAAMQCLQQTNNQPDAIITATGLGCLGDTEKFLKTIIDNNEELLNPTPFIQSTFNTVGAQTAINLKNTNYNMTYVHRGFSFESALLDGLMKLWDAEAENVLVGTYEETTDTSFQIMKRMGFWRKGDICGEGSHFFMLSSKPDNANTAIVLKDVQCVFDDKVEAIETKLNEFLQKNNLQKSDIDVVISGRCGKGKERIYYNTVESQFSDSSIVNYKPFFGSYQTVSSLTLWLAAQLIKDNKIPDYLLASNKNRQVNKVLIYNYYPDKNHSFLLVEKEA